MSNQSRYEKDEKDEKDEKEVAKQEEKTMEEKWRRDPLGTLIWALILIWAGLVWLGWNLGILTRSALLNRLMENSENLQPPFVSLIFIGAGIMPLLYAVTKIYLAVRKADVAEDVD